METWRLLAGVSVMLVLWVGVVTVMGYSPGPGGLLGAAAAAVVGLYLGEALSARLTGRGES